MKKVAAIALALFVAGAGPVAFAKVTPGQGKNPHCPDGNCGKRNNGVPAPIAGAGVVFLLVAGGASVVLLRRRRQLAV